MALSFELVDGGAFSAEGSRLLEAAWHPPALRYSTEYLRWQLAFPSSGPVPCSAAYEGGEPVGFAAATARRLRRGSREIDAVIVSFVAVHPEWRGRGAAAGLYRTLLKAIADRKLPVVTFAAPETAGETVLRRAYPEAGFLLRGLGTYSNYAFTPRGDDAGNTWRESSPEDAANLFRLTAALSAEDGTVLWSAPSGPQLEHYWKDPRPRKLLVVEDPSTGARGAGFIIRSELRTMRGIETVTTLDSVWLPSGAASGLHRMLHLAANAWSGSSGTSSIVMCPNLTGFDAGELRTIGVRKTPAQFRGYLCSIGEAHWRDVERTNLEIV